MTSRDAARALARAVLALLVSALVVAASVFALAPAGGPGGQAQRWQGVDFAVRLGEATATESGSQLLQQLSGGQAILSRKASLKAEENPYLRYRITGQQPGAHLFFIWWTEVDPGVVHRTRLLSRDGRITTQFLGDHPQWRGRVTELGFAVVGDLRGQALAFETPSLLPATRGHFLAAIWSQWSAFEPWQYSSINTLRGVPGKHALLSPTVAVAACALLALALISLAARLQDRWDRLASVLVLLIPWLVMDLHWQQKLSVQHAETRYLYGGKTAHEKRLAESDAALYRYAQRLKNDLLPDPGTKIYLLHDHDALSGGHNLRRLRTQYHLLPHNVFNFGRTPPNGPLSAGEYILALGPIDALHYAPEAGVLQWGDGRELPVTLLDQAPEGRLFQIAGKADE